MDRRGFIKWVSTASLLSVTDTFSQSKSSKIPFPELSAAGSPGALGFAHGKAFAEQIECNLEFYLGWLADKISSKDPQTKIGRSQLLEVASRFLPVLERCYPEQLEEIEGIARGAQRSMSEIMLINARTDLATMVHPHNLEAVPGCTAVALTGHTDDHQPALALGQNWDWFSRFSDSTVILHLKPANAPELITFTEAGMLGKIGFNAHKLGVCLNFLWHSSDSPYREFGVPIHCLLRAVMACATLEEAYKQVAWRPRCASANFMLAQHQDTHLEAMNLELTPDAIARLPLVENTLVHTNHYLSNSLIPHCEDQNDSPSVASSIARYETAKTVANALKKRESNPVARLQKILALREGGFPISRGNVNDTGGMEIRTLAGIVMDLSHKRLYLTSGPPHQTEWVEIQGIQ